MSDGVVICAYKVPVWVRHAMVTISSIKHEVFTDFGDSILGCKTGDQLCKGVNW